jgi:hypothetical protein
MLVVKTQVTYYQKAVKNVVPSKATSSSSVK